MKTDSDLKKTGDKMYLLDIKTIDEQHKHFFDIYDRLVTLSEDKSSVTGNITKNFLIELSDYTRYHFRSEEELMTLANYPEIDKHIKEHIYYIDKIDEFILAYEYKNPALLINMISFLKKWFLSHIMNTDAKYIDILKSYLKNNPSPTPR